MFFFLFLYAQTQIHMNTEHERHIIVYTDLPTKRVHTRTHTPPSRRSMHMHIHIKTRKNPLNLMHNESTCTHTHAPTYICTHSRTISARAQSHTRSHRHTHKRTQTYYVHPHTLTHRYTHTVTRKHTYDVQSTPKRFGSDWRLERWNCLTSRGVVANGPISIEEPFPPLNLWGAPATNFFPNLIFFFWYSWFFLS